MRLNGFEENSVFSDITDCTIIKVFVLLAFVFFEK